jgi:exosortase D (VPLPA-CTERM-specific)
MGNSVEIAPLASAGEGRLLSGLLSFQGWSLLLLLVWLYHSIIYSLVLQWFHDPNFSHGIFVPIFAAYVLWEDRKRLSAIPPAPFWTGLPLVFLALAMLILGVLGVELFTSRFSLLVLLAGLILMTRGQEFFRAVLFPWAFLILMIPLPNLILQKITFPLQLLASRLSTSMLQLVGVPVLREGNWIELAAMPLEVAEACSGLRSLLSLVTLAVIYGYLMEKRNWVRVVLACAAVPIAVLANSFRIFGTGLIVQYWDPEKAKGFYHEFQGWLVFVVSLVLLFSLHRLILIIWKKPPTGSRQSVPSAVYIENRRLQSVSPKQGSILFGIAVLPMLAAAIGLQAHSSTEIVKHVGSIPEQVSDWTGTDDPIDKDTLDILGPGEYLLRNYQNTSEPQPPINLYIPFFPSQSAGDTIHSPEHCLPGAGYIPISREVIQLPRPDGAPIPVNRYVVSKLGDRQLVLYWFQAHNRVVASEWKAKYYLIADSIHLNRSDGGMVRLMSPMMRGESADGAQARIMKLGSQLLPLIDTYIPQ